jgi:2-polyprenyl-6-methoxyphenol hydroxylase-like FAD-dependent oxidoreductase
VTLVERRRDFSREFRGEILMPGGVRALHEAGLGEILARVSTRHLDRFEIFLAGRRVLGGTPDLAPESKDRILAVSQAELLEAVVGDALTDGRLRFEAGALVTGLIQEGGRCRGVRVRREDGDEILRADLVIGTDGRQSAVRRFGGLSATRSSPPMDIVWCKIPAPEEMEGVRGYAGRGHLLVAYRTWDGLLQLGWVILKGTFGALRTRGIEDWVEVMADQVDPVFGAHLREHCKSVCHPFLLDSESDHVDTWSAPGLLVLGDAAHTMSPVGGQGVNVALRDALVAANHLVPLLGPGRSCEPPELDDAVRAIEAERAPEVRKIQQLQAIPPRVILSRAVWGEPLRRLVAWGAARWGASNGKIRLPPLFVHGAGAIRLEC